MTSQVNSFYFVCRSDWGQKPKIERALLDGSERAAIITTKIRWPNGLAIDTKESKLYFGDGFEHTVEWCRFDGSQRTLLIKDKAMYIFGFTLLDDWIYFRSVGLLLCLSDTKITIFSTN